jgi:hypothetical protein
MKHLSFYVVLNLIFVVSCAGCPGTGLQPITSDIQYCNAAEQNLQKLCNADGVKNAYCCEVVKPTKKNKSFTQFCQETANNGISTHSKCLSTITSCNQIDTCK